MHHRREISATLVTSSAGSDIMSLRVPLPESYWDGFVKVSDTINRLSNLYIIGLLKPCDCN